MPRQPPTREGATAVAAPVRFHRRTQADGESSATCGSVGRARGPRRSAADAGSAVDDRPAALNASCFVKCPWAWRPSVVVVTRLRPFGHRGGSEAASGGLGVVSGRASAG